MQKIKNLIDLNNFNQNGHLETKWCECGDTYSTISLGEGSDHVEKIIDPGKCSDCIRKDVEQENDELIEKANKHLLDREFMKYKKYQNIPPGCEGAVFDNYEPQNQTQTNALNKAKEFVENIDLDSNKSLMFQGTPGIGKSHLSVSIQKALKEKGIPSLIIDAPALFQTLKSYFGYSDSQQAQEKIMKLIKQVDVLILDDIGAEYVKSNDGQETWASDILYQIMNARQTKVNVFSTNYKSADLKQKYGSLSSRIISRMLSGAEVIKIEGQDQRMKGFE